MQLSRAIGAVPRALAMTVLTILVLGPLYWITTSAFKGRDHFQPLRENPELTHYQRNSK